MLEDVGKYSMYFRRRIVTSDEMMPDCVVDFDADGGVVGIEFLS